MEPRQKDRSDRDFRPACYQGSGRPTSEAERANRLCGLPWPGFQPTKGRFRGRNAALPQGLKHFTGARSPSPGDTPWRLYEWVNPPSPKAAEKEQGGVGAGLTATSSNSRSSLPASPPYPAESSDARVTGADYREDSNTPMEICGDSGHQDYQIPFQLQFRPLRSFHCQSQPCSPYSQSLQSPKLPCKRVSVSVERFPLTKRLCLLSP